MITWFSKPSTRFLMYSARRCFSEKPKIADFITDNRLYDKYHRLKGPEKYNAP